MCDVLATSLLCTFVGICLIGIDTATMDATNAASDSALIHKLTNDGALTGGIFLEGDIGGEGNVFKDTTALPLERA